MQGVQAIQDPETFKFPVSEGPQFEQTPCPIKTMLPQMGSITKTFGGTSPSRKTGELYSFIIVFNPFPVALFLFLS